MPMTWPTAIHANLCSWLSSGTMQLVLRPQILTCNCWNSSQPINNLQNEVGNLIILVLKSKPLFAKFGSGYTYGLFENTGEIVGVVKS